MPIKALTALFLGFALTLGAQDSPEAVDRLNHEAVRMGNALDSLLLGTQMLHRALRWSEAHDYYQGQETALTHLNILFLRLADLDSALHFAQRHAELSARQGKPRDRAVSAYRIGLTHLYGTDAQAALPHLLAALRLESQFEDAELSMGLRAELAGIYISMGLPDPAIGYLAEGLRMAEAEASYWRIANFSSRLAFLYEDKGEAALAERYFQQAYASIPRIEADELKVAVLHKAAQWFGRAQQYERAEQLLREALGYAGHFVHESWMCLNALADLELKRQRPDRAIAALQNGWQQYGEPGDRGLLHQSYELLSRAHELRNESAQALLYNKLAQALRDSLTQAERSREVMYLERKFQSERKDELLALQAEQMKVQRLNASLYLLGACVLAALLGLGLLLIERRRRLAQQANERLVLQHEVEMLQAKMQSREAERRKLSRDLHDELGASLSSVHIYSSVVQAYLEKDPAQAAPYVGKIADTSAQLMASLSDMVWAMQPDAESLGRLNERLWRAAQDLLPPKGIALHLALPSGAESLQLHATARKNLFLIAKEALHNVAKHSGGRACQVAWAVEGAHLLLSVCDDGQGMGSAVAGLGGNGLRNIRHRAAQLAGECHWAAGPDGQGTCLQGRWPLAALQEPGI